MLRVALIGCGKIADSHASQIQRIPGCEIVGVCDREGLMARQLLERFPVREAFCDVDELLRKAKPDVVHITTPPQSHFELARACLDRGCHVYVEKPFTVRVHEAEELVQMADGRELRLTVGHDDQFSPVARRLRRVVREGYLGGSPVHMESCYGYDLGDPRYARVLLTDQGHWVRRLPGQLLQNIISHGVARVAEFLAGESPTVLAHGFVSPFLASLGEKEMVDELRVIIKDERMTTAYFTFSSQVRPLLHQFRMYGPKQGLLLDEDQQTLIRLKGERYKSHLERFVPPLNFARQYLGNFRTNLHLFLGRDFHMKSGMKSLIESFYHAIASGAPPPIPYEEILRTARIMDSIFQQVASSGGGGCGGEDQVCPVGMPGRAVVV